MGELANPSPEPPGPSEQLPQPLSEGRALRLRWATALSELAPGWHTIAEIAAGDADGQHEQQCQQRVKVVRQRLQEQRVWRYVQVVDAADSLRRDGVTVQTVSFQADRPLHDRYGINAVPTTLFVDDEGVVQKWFVGRLRPDPLREALDASPGALPEAELLNRIARIQAESLLARSEEIFE